MTQQLVIQPNKKIALEKWKAFESVTDGVMHTVAVNSQRVYNQAYRSWASWCEFNHHSPTDLRPAAVIAFLKSERTTKSTRQRKLSALRQLARAMSLIDQSLHPIYDALKMIKAPTGGESGMEHKKRPLDVEQARRLMNVFSDSAKLLDYRNRAMISLMLATGLRREEVTMLEWLDIDLKEGILTVRHGKGDKSREVAIVGQSPLDTLKAWRKEQGEGYSFVFTPITKSNRVGQDRPITPQTVFDTVKVISAVSGVDFSPHDTRRAHATELLNTESLADVQAQLGHAHGSTTLRYASGADAMKRRAKFKLRYNE